MNVVVVAVGKLKEKYLVEGVAEYQKRLQGYLKIEVIEVKEESFREPLSSKSVEQIKEKEGKRILDQIPSGSFAIILDPQGKTLMSDQLATEINNLAIYGRSNIAFVIGGSLGLGQNVISRADFILSFSRFTFPHQLIRLILMEQLYRVMTIIKGEKYHK